MESKTKLSYKAFDRIARKIGAQIDEGDVKNFTKFDYSRECGKNEKIYLWCINPELVPSKRNEKKFGEIIYFAYSDEEESLQKKIPDFTHIGIFNEEIKKLTIFCSSREELQKWQDENLDFHPIVLGEKKANDPDEFKYQGKIIYPDIV